MGLGLGSGLVAPCGVTPATAVLKASNASVSWRTRFTSSEKVARVGLGLGLGFRFG